MSGYTIRATRVSEDGYEFDSVLERDWAGFIAHMGLRWKREPFAVRRGVGPTTTLNIISRPDFFLPDLAVIFEVKPSMDMAMAEAKKFRHTAEVTGLPVVVTTSAPRPQTYSDRPLPPLLLAFSETGRRSAVVCAQCPDCDARGLWLLHSIENGNLLDSDWLSPCRHQMRGMAPDAFVLFPQLRRRLS